MFAFCGFSGLLETIYRQFVKCEHKLKYRKKQFEICQPFENQ